MTRKYQLHEFFARGEGDEGDKPDYAALLQAPEVQEYINSLLGTKIQDALERETGTLKKSKSEILDEKKKLESHLKALTPDEWIPGLTQTKPHYFKAMAGAGSKCNPGGQRTVTLKEWQSLIATANQEEHKKHLGSRASGELRTSK